MNPAAVVYLVTNKITGQQYIGLTRFTAAKRWTQHIQKSKAKDTGSWFHRAIAKYGADANTGKKRTFEQNAANSARKKAEYADPVRRATAVQMLRAVRGLVNEDKRLAAVREALKARVWSDESKAKLSASCMGRHYGQDVIDRMREKKKKSVECVDLHCTFDSVLEAAEATGIYFSSISKACIGKHKTAGGMRFQFA